MGLHGAEEGNKLLIIRDVRFERTEDYILYNNNPFEPVSEIFFTP